MVTMTTVEERTHHDGMTHADLRDLPDDGRRHEIVDGVLVVTPAPGDRHQGAVVELILLLGAACPADLRVRTAPYDVILADDTVLQPDVLVARQSDIEPHGLPAPPLLAVEVLSPSTRRVDMRLKRTVLEEAGVPSYWLVDPDRESVTILELGDEGYVEVARVTGPEELRVTRPFPITVVPSRLFR